MEAKEAEDMTAVINKLADERIKLVWANREEILRAFVAKFGYEPDRVIQVVDANGSWYVHRMDESQWDNEKELVVMRARVAELEDEVEGLASELRQTSE